MKQSWPIDIGHFMQELQEACIQDGKMVAIVLRNMANIGLIARTTVNFCIVQKTAFCLLYYLVKMKKSGFRRPEYLPILRHQAQISLYCTHLGNLGAHGQVTAERVKSYFSKRVEGDCERFDLPGWCLTSVKLL